MINPLKKLEVNRFVLRHPTIAESLSGFQIAQVTDVHMGRWVKPRHLRQLVEFVDAQNPDLVALTGDYVGYSKLDLFPCVEEFSKFQTPTFAVLGNHDHWAGTDISVEAFEKYDVPLMRNEWQMFQDRDDICVVGVDDHVTKNADAEKAFDGSPDGVFKLVLNHVPSGAWESADRGAGLILSGHTHGFQFNIPRITNAIAERFGTKLFAGPYRLEDAILYISRGIGSASWPRRIRALPELTFFELQPGPIPELELLSHETMGVAHRP